MRSKNIRHRKPSTNSAASCTHNCQTGDTLLVCCRVNGWSNRGARRGETALRAKPELPTNGGDPTLRSSQGSRARKGHTACGFVCVTLWRWQQQWPRGGAGSGGRGGLSGGNGHILNLAIRGRDATVHTCGNAELKSLILLRNLELDREKTI